MIHFLDERDVCGMGRITVDGRFYGMPYEAVVALRDSEVGQLIATQSLLIEALQALYRDEKLDDDDERLIRTRVKVSQLLHSLGVPFTQFSE